MLTQSGISNFPLQVAMQQRNTDSELTHQVKSDSKGSRNEAKRPTLLTDRPVTRKPRKKPDMRGINNLAVLDIFELYKKGDSRYHTYFDLDRNGVTDLSHGELVAGSYLAAKPKGKVHAYKVRGESGAFGIPSGKSSLRQLNRLYSDIESGKPIDGLNLSIGTAVPYEMIASKAKRLQRIPNFWYDPKKYNGLTEQDLERLAAINPKTVGQAATKKSLRKMLPLISTLDDKIISKIEDVRAKGVSVFLAAGNDPSQSTFDAWGLAKGITVVSGQISPRNKKVNRSLYTDNSEVDATALAEYGLKPTCNRRGQITGVDFNSDGKREFALRHKTGRWVDNPYEFSGTSFAAPAFAGEYRKPKPSLTALA